MGSLEQAQRRAGWTAPAIAFAIVAEPVTAEVFGSIRIDRLGTRHNGGDAVPAPQRALLAVRIARVGHRRPLLGPDRLLALRRHPMKLPLVVGLAAHFET